MKTHRVPGLRTMTALIMGAAIIMAAAVAFDRTPETWRGLVVAPEHRCAPYRRSDYPYPPSVEARIVAAQGGRVYGPYTGRTFSDTRRTDIEHIVAASEAHDSGLCAQSAAARRRFATDLLNLTLAAPEVNRCGAGGKCGLDAGEWLPRVNRCWFAGRVVAVRTKYRLTIDRRETDALDPVLSGCASTEMVFFAGPSPKAPLPGGPEPLRLWDDNGDGRITCREARQHRIAPVPRSHPAYPFMRDRDRDGVVCE